MSVRQSSHSKRLSMVAVTLVAGLASADELTLERALNEGLSQSPAVQKAASQKEEASWKRVESFSGHLPSLSAGVSLLTDKKYALTDVQFPGSPVESHIPQIIPTASYTLNLQFPIFDGFATSNRYWAARESEDAAGEEFNWARFQHQRQITLAFYKALAYASLQDVAEQSSKTFEDHLKDTKLFKSSGLSTHYDVLRVEVQVNEAQTEVLNSKDNADMARLKLNELLGNDEDLRPLAGTLLVPEETWIQKITGESGRSDVAALRHRVESAKYQDKAAGRYLVPRVSLFGQYQEYNNRSDHYEIQHEDFRDAYQVGVLLTWNLFDGFASVARSHQATEQKYQAEKSLRLTDLKSKQDVEFWKRKFLYFCKVYKTRLSDVSKSTETWRLAREGRRAGTRTNTDLLDAETELFRAKANVINAQLGAIEAWVNLELATGQGDKS